MPRTARLDRTHAAALAAAAVLHAALAGGALLWSAPPLPPRERPVMVAVVVSPPPETLSPPAPDAGPPGALPPKPRPARLSDDPAAGPAGNAFVFGEDERCRPGPDGAPTPDCPERWARPEPGGDALLHDDAARVLGPGYAGRSLAEHAAERGWIAPPRRVLREFAHRDRAGMPKGVERAIGDSPIPPATETRALPVLR